MLWTHPDELPTDRLLIITSTGFLHDLQMSAAGFRPSLASMHLRAVHQIVIRPLGERPHVAIDLGTTGLSEREPITSAGASYVDSAVDEVRAFARDLQSVWINVM
jgi:hypothetical protein